MSRKLRQHIARRQYAKKEYREGVRTMMATIKDFFTRPGYRAIPVFIYDEGSDATGYIGSLIVNKS